MPILKPDKEYTGRATIRMYNCDCMELMRSGKTWDLAIVDPPYGVGCAKTINIKNEKRGFSGNTLHESKEWDDKIPNKEYFNKLLLVSNNQIIWGGNYFTEHLKPVKAWIFWDKKESKNQGSNFSDGELAWTSFNKVTKYYKYGWIGIDYCNKPEIKNHPTQKPIQLYKWLLTNYAKPGDTILDTHGGSLSIAIACWDLGFDLDVCELDKDYFDAAVKRFENHIAQQALF